MASRIKPVEWTILYAVTGALDVAQFFGIEVILIWVFGAGAITNEVLDPIVGIALTSYFFVRGVELLKYPSRLGSLLGTEVVEEGTGGIAQFWILDVWYIRRSVKNEEKQRKATIAETVMMRQQVKIAEADSAISVNAARAQLQRGPPNQNGVRYPDNQTGPLNNGGTRLPTRSPITAK